MNPAETSADLLVSGKYLYLHDKDKTLLENGSVAIRRDSIIATGTTADLTAKYPAAEHLVADHGLIMPGLINSHIHSAMASCFDMIEALLPMHWEHGYAAPHRGELSDEIVYQATLLGLAAMIKSGTTSFCSTCLYAGDMAKGAEEAGMRAWIGEPFNNFAAPGQGPATSTFAALEDLFAMYGGHPLINITVAPYSVSACAPELLRDLKRMADRHEALYIIHLPETAEKIKASMAQHGTTPVMHLENLGLLDSRVVADHCVILQDAEIALLALRGVKVVHCPATEMHLASGAAVVPRMLAAGIPVGIGTDSSTSTENTDMFAAMNGTAKLHKVHLLDPTAMPATTVMEMATWHGASVLNAENALGSLKPGKKADLIVLDMNQPHLTPLFNIPSHAVYAARGADVIHSIINGTVVMRNRQLTTLDEKTILDNIMSMRTLIRK
ncbi:MAG: amidohydrolase family protein [Desulfobulbales bacterium]